MAVGKLPFSGESLGQMLSWARIPRCHSLRGNPSDCHRTWMTRCKTAGKGSRQAPASAAEVRASCPRLPIGCRLHLKDPDCVRCMPSRSPSSSGRGMILPSPHESAWKPTSEPNNRPPTLSSPLYDYGGAPRPLTRRPHAALYRSASPFGTTGDIWLKLLPDGEPVQSLTIRAKVRHFILSWRRSYRVYRLPPFSPPF